MKLRFLDTRDAVDGDFDALGIGIRGEDAKGKGLGDRIERVIVTVLAVAG